MSTAAVRVVLVHGGWVDASSWGKVIDQLPEAEFDVVAPQLGLSNLNEDAALVRRVIDQSQAPTIVVGHSYGGAVITQASAGADQVITLIYVATSLPKPGETLGELMAAAGGDYTPNLSVDETGFISATQDVIVDCLAPDLSAQEQRHLLATQRPVAAALFGASCSAVGWQEKPCIYLLAEHDRLNSTQTQERQAERANARIVRVESGHMVPLVQPQAVVEAIRLAAQLP